MSVENKTKKEGGIESERVELSRCGQPRSLRRGATFGVGKTLERKLLCGYIIQRGKDDTSSCSPSCYGKEVRRTRGTFSSLLFFYMDKQRQINKSAIAALLYIPLAFTHIQC